MPALITPEQLRRAVDASNKALQQHRAMRLENFREFHGRFYPTSIADGTRRHLNMIHRFVSVMLPHLAMRNPEHEVRPIRRALAGEAAMLSLLLDYRAKKSKRRKLSRACLMDALLGPKAIVKHGLKVNEDLVKVDGRMYSAGEPYTLRIAYDDYVCDPSARCDEELLWEGHYYRLPRARALESGIFDPAVIERLPGLSEGHTRDGKQTTMSDTAAGGLGAEERYGLLDRIELIDIALYDDEATYIVTIPSQESGVGDGDFLRVREWQGYGRGPFIRLEFQPINDQSEGLPPVSVLREQAEAFYAVVNKMVSQAEDGKRVLLASKDAPEDEITEIRDAEDHSIIRVTNPKDYVNADLGGMNESLAELASMLQGWFNTQGNNPDILGGTGTDTDKATIYSGLQANANTMVEDMADAHDEFQSELSAADAFYALEDPYMTQPLEVRVPGGEMFEVVYDARARQGAYQDFMYEIRPRSTGHVDPAVRSQRLIQHLDTIMHAAEISAATGGYINVPGVAKISARQLDMREVEDVVNDPTITAELDAILANIPMRGQGAMPAGVTPGMNPPGPRMQLAGQGRAGAQQPAKTPIGAVRSAMTQGQPPAPRLAG